MKSLQRYEMNEWGCDIPASDGDWVKWEDVTKLEKQNEKMLYSLKICTELLMLISMDPANSPFPLTPVSDMRPQILDTISNAVEIITDIEGEKK